MASIDKIIPQLLLKTKFKLNDINFKLNDKGSGEVWIKMNGDFQRAGDGLFSDEDVKKFIQDILKQRDLTYADFVKLKDLDISYETSIDGQPIYFRVNLFFSSGRPGVILRYIKSDIPSLEKLNFPVKYIQKFLTAQDGLLLVAGSTGSGKSTTIAAIIDYYNATRKSHILTLEDPIEYRFTSKLCGFNQREIGTDSISYKNGLMSALREAPDIIFLGELREFDTIELALKLSESGHLVISTIHTKDASSVISRILNVTPADRLDEVRTVLASAFRGVVWQDLIPTKEGGRVLVIETMYEHHTVGAAISQNELGKLRSIIQTNRDAGMITKDQYIENEIIPKQIVEAKVLKTYMPQD